MSADVCVIYNPVAGRGRAGDRLDAVRRRLGARAEFRPTAGPGHAVELARAAAVEGFPVVGAAGGDGTVHEVANGVLLAARPEAALTVFPVGSANDYAHSLGHATAWKDPGGTTLVRPVDVGEVTAPGGRRRYFVNGLGLGFNGAVTLETRAVRGLQGVPLYTAGLLRALWRRFDCPTMTLRLDGEERRAPTLALTIALGRREGNFVLAPRAVLDDGLFDFLCAGGLSRLRLLRYVPAMITGRLPENDPLVRSGQCRVVEVESEAPLIVHTDGEFFCRPEDEVHRLAVRLLPGALQVRLPSAES